MTHQRNTDRPGAPGPPLARFAAWLIHRGKASREAEFVLGDLHEDHRRIAADHGSARAAAWYWTQVVVTCLSRRKTSALDLPEKDESAMIEQTFRDLAGALRSARTRPGFSLLVVLTLAVGIGATTAIFSVVNAVVLQALPYPEADRLAILLETLNETHANRVPTSFLTYQDWKTADSFDEMAVVAPFNTMILTGPDETLRLRANLASSAYFDLMGVTPAHGRFYGPEYDNPDSAADVVVISHGLWQRRFGEREDVIGEQVSLNGTDYSVIGVASAGFVDLYSGGTPTDIWVPLTAYKQLGSATALERRVVRPFQALGRLASSVSVEAAQQEMDGIARGIQEASPAVMGTQGVAVIPMREQLVGGLNAPLLTLLVGSSFLLLMGCINVASLMLFRGTARAREIAIRQAMGATRGRLVRLLVTEALVLAAAGGALGLLIAEGGVGILLNLNAVPLPAYIDVGLDLVVLGVTVAVILLAGVGVGLLPALRTTANDIGTVLTESDLRTAGHSSRRSANVLVVAEVAVAMVLMVGSGLMLRSFQHLSGADLGFRTDDIMSVRVNLPRTDYPTEELVFGFRERLVEQLRSHPGMEFAATWGPGLPGQAGSYTTAVPEGKIVESQLEADLTRLHMITPGALARLDIPLLAGRLLNDTDTIGSQSVAVISSTLAETLWPGEDSIGRRMNSVIPPDRDPADYPPYEVVGVVADASLGGRLVGNFGVPPLNDMYVPFQQKKMRNNISSFAVLTGMSGDTDAAMQLIRDAVRETDPNVPVFNPQDLETAATAELVLSRFIALLMGIFGSISLLLAAIGIYGILSQSVAARTREIGVRKALGAESSATAWLVVSYGMRLSLIGVVVGLALAVGLSRYVSSLLYGIAGTDPVTLVGTVATLLAVALLASYVPTRRALRVDPVDSLRAD